MLPAELVLREKTPFSPSPAHAFVPARFVFKDIKAVVRMGPGPKDVNRDDGLAVLDRQGLHLFKTDLTLAATILGEEAKTLQSKNR